MFLFCVVTSIYQLVCQQFSGPSPVWSVCGGVLACISPTPLHLLCILAITSASVAGCPGARSLVDPACGYVIMSSIVLASIYGILGSQ